MIESDGQSIRRTSGMVLQADKAIDRQIDEPERVTCRYEPGVLKALRTLKDSAIGSRIIIHKLG